MKTCLNVVRWILGILLGVILIVVIVAGTAVISVSTNITSEEVIKSWLVESQIYSNIDEILIETLENQVLAVPDEKKEVSPETTETQENIVVPDQFDEIILNVLTPERVQNLSESAIAAFFEWARSDEIEPSFNIRIFESDQEILDIVSLSFAAKTDGLPECLDGQNPGENPFEWTCRPQNFNSSVFFEFLGENIDDPQVDEFLSTFRGIDSESVEWNLDTLDKVKSVYSVFELLPWIFLGVLVGLNILMLIFVPKLQSGLFVSSGVFILSSIILLIIRGILSGLGIDVIDRIITSTGAQISDTVLSSMINLYIAVYRDISAKMTAMALTILVVGFSYLLFGYGVSIIKKQKNIEGETKYEPKENTANFTSNEKI